MKSRSGSRSRPASSRRSTARGTRPARKRAKTATTARPKVRGAAPRARRAVVAPKPAGRPWLAVVAACGLGLGILWAPFLPIAFPKPTRVWRGYDTLLVRAGGPADSRLEQAVKHLGPGVVGQHTTTVDFYDFSSSARARLADLPRRLDPLDPRRDPYIDGMAGYFSVTSGEADFHVAYIPARWSAPRLFIALARMLGPWGSGAWRLVEFDPAEKLLSVASAIAFAFLLASGSRRRGPLAFVMTTSALWIPAILAGGPGILALCLILLFFWGPLLRARLASSGPEALPEKLRKPFIACSVISAASIAIFSFLNGSSASEVMQPAAPFLCTLLLFLFAPAFLSTARRKSPVFSPIPLLWQGNGDGKGRQRALSVALFAIAGVVLVPLARGGAFPAPLRVIGVRSFSWDAVTRLRHTAGPDRLPDFSDLVAHEAYQQTLGFGKAWHYPVRDERIYRRDYLVDPATGTVSARLQTVKTFNSTWLASVIDHPEPGSLEALLRWQGRPVAVAVRGPARALARELPFTALAFCALLTLLCRDLRLGLLIRGNLWRLIGEARRDQVQ